MFRKKRQKQLDNLITAIIVKNQDLMDLRLNYFQGFNDVVSVFLLTLDSNLAFYCTDIFSRFFLIDYFQLEFDKGLIPIFGLCSNLLRAVDEDLFNFVTLDGEKDPMFIASWCLTLFAHCTHNLECTRRIYDLILAEHPLIIVYLCVSLMIELQDDLYNQPEDYD